MNRITCYVLLFFMSLSLITQAQQSAIFDDPNEHFKKGMEFYEGGLFGASQVEFKKVIELTRAPHEISGPENLRKQAQLHYGFAAIRLNHPEGERIVLDFIRDNEPSAMANMAKLEMGDYYYNNRDYQKAIEYYNSVEPQSLGNDEINQLEFRRAYSYFVRKKFKQAKAGFSSIKDVKNENYYPANYYFGMCAFFEEDYDVALRSFQRVNTSKKYSSVIPYYICQIYFAEGQHDQLIAYAEPLVDGRTLKYKKEINQLIGQSYFELGNYDKALPYLEKYVAESNKLTEKEVYQLAYTQYQTGNDAQAIENFEALRDLDSELGQNALFNLANTYIRNNKKNTARSALLQASQMTYDPKVQEDAKFNYAKLSYELGYDREAINSLLEFKPGTTYYRKAQELLGNIFLNTRDYARTLEIIEGLPNRNERIEEAYQKVAYYRGVQLFYGDQKEMARDLFNKAADRSYDLKTKALANYWLGEIDYLEGDYDFSIDHFNKYLSIAKTLPVMPDEASVHTANYSLGYNYWKKKQYGTARGYFVKAVDGISQNRNLIQDEYIKTKLLSDAKLRTADCYFKANNYPRALTHYNAVIASKSDGYDYALFQKATILGLQGESIDKILLLESIYKNYPNSTFADDAMFELGNTYLNLGRLDNAAPAFESFLLAYPQSEWVNSALLKLGLIYVNVGQAAKGLEYYKRVFANNPEPAIAKDALNGIEEIYIALGDPDGYVAFLESVPGYQVSNAQKDSINFRVAQAFYGEGDYLSAAKAYGDYIRKYPNGNSILMAHYNRAESYWALKDYPKAATDYAYLVSKTPNRYASKSANRAALIYYNVDKDFPKAYTNYIKYAELATSPEQLYEAQLGALRSAYRAKLAEPTYSMADAIANNPKSSQAEQAEAQYYVAKLALENQQFDRSRKAFNNVIKLTDDERSAEARYSIAYIYYLERDLDTAKELALSTNSQIGGYEYWLAKSVLLVADIFVEQGDSFNARAALESIVENYDGDAELLQEARTKLAKLNAQKETDNSLKFREDNNSGSELELDAPIDNQ